ncbi:hypothetical protein DACRYDRAFT_20497 [Dacryopinax primogenitus]|uniref:Uncharacterized protein n=1 Tax=Dacryopinax primogenitus (strain DJM 731) TaxID=1858805 RepID=M5G3S7_DACPD|nr:uncharacterized protein DACRYDRAFT_20497 [Dacryopinax primogenitus]EJU04901.1 hypothetical protein DACRYDRAFT_20497 [Dacryopinax primogenitus]
MVGAAALLFRVPQPALIWGLSDWDGRAEFSWFGLEVGKESASAVVGRRRVEER